MERFFFIDAQKQEEKFKVSIVETQLIKKEFLLCEKYRFETTELELYAKRSKLFALHRTIDLIEERKLEKAYIITNYKKFASTFYANKNKKKLFTLDEQLKGEREKWENKGRNRPVFLELRKRLFQLHRKGINIIVVYDQNINHKWLPMIKDTKKEFVTYMEKAKKENK